MAFETERSCRNCKNPYCTRTMEERQNREVQVHLQYGWECEDKEKYLEHNSGLQIIQWHNLRKNPDDVPTNNGIVLNQKGEYVRYFPNEKRWTWQNGDSHGLEMTAWCEKPTFKE